jgi:hypothetical protein
VTLSAAAINEGVHLLLDDVGVLADGAAEELRPLEQRQADLAVAVRGQRVAQNRFELLPARCRSGRMSFIPRMAWIRRLMCDRA